MPPTPSIRRAAAVIWRHSTDLKMPETIEIATEILTTALTPDVTAEGLWNMDQNSRNPVPRPWSDASPGEREPYMETATEIRDVVVGFLGKEPACNVEVAHAGGSV